MNQDGTIGANLDPNPNDGVYEANVGIGERFVVRTLAKDLRALDARGVFSVYTDVSYQNTDGSGTEKLQLQWGEQAFIQLPKSANQGSFRLRIGSDLSSPITPVYVATSFNALSTGRAIETALSSMVSVGFGNVKVTALPSGPLSEFIRYSVAFMKNKARIDLPDLAVEDSQVRDASNQLLSIGVTGTPNATASTQGVLNSALNLSPLPNQTIKYTQGREGVADFSSSGSGLFRINQLGSFSSSQTGLNGTAARQSYAIYDLEFVAGEAGVVSMVHRITPILPEKKLGVALYGFELVYLDETQVVLPTATIRVIDRLVARPDSYTVVEDAAPLQLDVLQNDTTPVGTSGIVIQSITQPSTGGSVSIASDNKSLIYTPQPNFFGVSSFHYTIINNVGETANGQVIVNISNVNDPPTLAPIADIDVVYNAFHREVLLTGVSSGLGESEALAFNVTSSNTEIIGTPIVEYVTGSDTAILRLPVIGNEQGTSTITVTMSDPSGESVTRSFQVRSKGLRAPALFQNPTNFTDVDGDGFTSPLDVLNILNRLNQLQDPSISVSSLANSTVKMDVNGDQWINALDMIAIVDRLNHYNSESNLSFADYPLGFKGVPIIDLKYRIVEDTGSGPGIDLDPTPGDNITEVVVARGSSFFVQLLAKDLRSQPGGVQSNYSDLIFRNSDGSGTVRIQPASVATDGSVVNSIFGNEHLKQGILVNNHSAVPGQRILSGVGSLRNEIVPPENAGTYLPILTVRFQALENGVVDLTQQLAGYELGVPGISVFSSTADFLASNEVILPTARIVVSDTLIANDDQVTGTEDQSVTIDVLANDIDATRRASFVLPIAPPTVGGTLTVVSNKILYTPPANFHGTASFSYTIVNSLGSEDTAEVRIDIAPVNDPPVLPDFTDLVLEEYFVYESGPIVVSSGALESQPIRLSAVSSDTNLVPNPIWVEGSTGEYRLKIQPNLDSFGQSVSITVTAEDGGNDNDLLTTGDNETTTKSFQVVIVSGHRDYGDAPSSAQSGMVSSYPTLGPNGGAFHVGNQLRLGALRDAELNGNPNGLAMGDDLDAADDEDGILFPFTHPINNVETTISSYVALASHPGFLDVWLDFNRDGDWDDNGEQVSTAVPVVAGRNIIPFTIPTLPLTGTVDTTFGRFRLSREGGWSSTGFGKEGEVEDHTLVLNRSFSQELEAYDQILGPHSVNVVGGYLVITSENKVVFRAPADNISVFRRKNASGETTFEMRNPGGALPGRLSYSESTGKSSLELTTTSLDLTSNRDSLIGISTISLVDSAAKTLSLELADVKGINSDKTLRVEMTQEDAIKTVTQWVASGGRVENGMWVQVFTVPQQDGQLEVVTDRPWRNETRRPDTNGDSFINALDALALVNAINSEVFGSGGLLPDRTTVNVVGFYDPDGDRFLSPLDVLSIVNFINQTRPGSGGRGEGESDDAKTTSTADVDQTIALLNSNDEWLWHESDITRRRRTWNR